MLQFTLYRKTNFGVRISNLSLKQFKISNILNIVLQYVQMCSSSSSMIIHGIEKYIFRTQKGLSHWPICSYKYLVKTKQNKKQFKVHLPFLRWSLSPILELSWGWCCDEEAEVSWNVQLVSWDDSKTKKVGHEGFCLQ